jgi:hypothetical protein
LILGDFVCYVVFDDGKRGDVDFSEYAGEGPVFEPLRDKTIFQQGENNPNLLAPMGGGQGEGESTFPPEKILANSGQMPHDVTLC